MAPLRAVLLDMDGLLIESERLSRTAWQEVSKLHGFNLTDEIFEQVIGLSADESHVVFREHLGSHFPAEQIRKEKEIFLTTMLQKTGMPLREGAAELLSFLDSNKIQYGIVTSTSRMRAGDRLRYSPIASSVPIIASGEEVERKKPSPDLYTLALSRIALMPEEVIAIEDSPSGVASAVAAGLRVVLVPDLRAPDELTRASAVRVLNTLLHVPDFLMEFL